MKKCAYFSEGRQTDDREVSSKQAVRITRWAATEKARGTVPPSSIPSSSFPLPDGIRIKALFGGGSPLQSNKDYMDTDGGASRRELWYSFTSRTDFCPFFYKVRVHLKNRFENVTSSPRKLLEKVVELVLRILVTNKWINRSRHLLQMPTVISPCPSK